MESKRHVVPLEEKLHEVSEEGLPIAPKRVLLVEDNEDLIASLKPTLEAQGWQVAAVGNGAEGLRKLMAEDFDVIVCDMVMPTLPGDKFFLAVERVRPDLCKRFVFMTGFSAEQRWDEFARSKGCLILWKPFALDVFLEAVEGTYRKPKAPAPRGRH